MEPWNRFQGMNSASVCSLAGRYDNPIPTRCLAPIDCLIIPAQEQSDEEERMLEKPDYRLHLKTISTQYLIAGMADHRKY